MPVEIKIPSSLSQYTGGKRVVAAEGTTVCDALRQLVAEHPELGTCLFDGEGNLLWFVRVFKNGVSVVDLEGLETPVTDQDELTLLAAMAGG
jgi:molybdopterin converting factor small subunit